MATSRISNLSQFRESFAVQNIVDRLPSWFPGHMYKGMKQMQKRLAIVDCIIEVHDARIPFSGRNPKFYSMLYAIKPHILVLNKMDLVDMSYKSSIVKKLNAQGVNSVLFTNLNGSKHNVTNEVIPRVLDLIQNSDRYNREKSHDLCTMIIGIPNVGKSSLINRLRNETLGRKNATAVGAKPGVTKSVLEKIKVSDSPVMFVLDTPGVMQPHVKDVEFGLRLALCCTLNDSVVGEEIIADYLLYWLNKHQNFRYVEYLGIKEPVDDIMTLLFQTAVIRNKTILRRLPEGSCKKFPDTLYAAKYFIAAFRKGVFGKVFVDDDLLDTKF